MWISAGARSDWPYFARWHYRSHHLGAVRFVTLLWYGRLPEDRAVSSPSDNDRQSPIANPIGICVFTSPPLSLRQRNRYFGLSGRWTRTGLRAMNSQLVTLSRVVIHPTFRGAGIAAAFVRQSCRLCRWPWVEALAQMGHVNPFFEKAGFVRVGVTGRATRSRKDHSSLYGAGGRRHAQATLLTTETSQKSRYSQPVYYVFDNRAHVRVGQHVEFRIGDNT